MLKPNKNQAALMIGFSALVGMTAVDYIETVKTERARRKQIKLDMEKNIAEILYARDKTLEKINSGAYDKSMNVETIFSDFEFYRLAHRFEE